MREIRNQFIILIIGMLSTLVLALIAAWIESEFNVLISDFSLCGVIPLGAIFMGYLAGRGCAVGARVVDRKPGKFILAGMFFQSFLFFLLILFFRYREVQLESEEVITLIEFGEFLRQTIATASVQDKSTFGSLLVLAYVLALIPVLGFFLGSAFVYLDLRTKPYCETCLSYLKQKRKQSRFTWHIKEAEITHEEILKLVERNAFSEAVRYFEQHAGPEKIDDSRHNIRADVTVMHCNFCGQHHFAFEVFHRRDHKKEWVQVNRLSIEKMSDTRIDI